MNDSHKENFNDGTPRLRMKPVATSLHNQATYNPFDNFCKKSRHTKLTLLNTTGT